MDAGTTNKFPCRADTVLQASRCDTLPVLTFHRLGLLDPPQFGYGVVYRMHQHLLKGSLYLLKGFTIVLERYLGSDGKGSIDWESMSFGAPTVIGMAQLCSHAMMGPMRALEELSIEAKAILYLARERGILELRGTNDAFESCQRLLTIFIECSNDQSIALKAPGNVRQSVKFLEGLRQACQAGLVLHHLQREFSLSAQGFDFAEQIDEGELAEVLEYAQRSE